MLLQRHHCGIYAYFHSTRSSYQMSGNVNNLMLYSCEPSSVPCSVQQLMRGIYQGCRSSRRICKCIDLCLLISAAHKAHFQAAAQAQSPKIINTSPPYISRQQRERR